MARTIPTDTINRVRIDFSFLLPLRICPLPFRRCPVSILTQAAQKSNVGSRLSPLQLRP